MRVWSAVWVLAFLTGCPDSSIRGTIGADASDAAEGADAAATLDAADPGQDSGPAETGADAAMETDAAPIEDTGEPNPTDGGEPLDTGVITAGCTGSTALFCEDFESLAAGPAQSPAWSANASSTSALTIDAEQARGTQALHVHTELNGWAFLSLDFAPPSNSFFGRIYLFVTAFPSAPDWAHFTLVEANGNGAGVIRPIGGQYVPPGNGGPGSFWGIGSDGGPTGDWTDWRTSAPTVAGRWLCMEFALDASNNSIEVSIDGVAQPDLSVSTSQHGGNAVDFVFPQFQQINFGWQLYQGGSTPAEFDVWLDDLVLDTQRVGCP